MHWNNEEPLECEVTVAAGVQVTPAAAAFAVVEELADADPREFLVDIRADDHGEPLDVRVTYYACDDANTFCVQVTQRYAVHLEVDSDAGRVFGAWRPGPRRRPVRRSRRSRPGCYGRSNDELGRERGQDHHPRRGARADAGPFRFDRREWRRDARNGRAREYAGARSRPRRPWRSGPRSGRASQIVRRRRGRAHHSRRAARPHRTDGRPLRQERR